MLTSCSVFCVAGLWGLFGLIPGPSPSVDGPPDFAKKIPEVTTGDPLFEFNGQNLDGFYTYLREHKYDDPESVFRVENRMIRISGAEFGGLITNESFENYLLTVEWKWGDETFSPRKARTRDSGILLHGVGPDGAANGAWLQSQECQLIEGGSGDFIIVRGEGMPQLTAQVTKKSDGQYYFDPIDGIPVTRTQGRFNWWGRDPGWRDELGFRGPNDVEKPVGEWNRMEVLCQGDRITNILNGLLVNAGTDSSLTRGKILLQSEGAELFVRRFEVRPIIDPQ